MSGRLSPGRWAFQGLGFPKKRHVPHIVNPPLARDGHRCRTPGSGSARFLEVHHAVARALGGPNRPDNLVTLCSACHRLTHSLAFHAAGLPGAVQTGFPRAAQADYPGAAQTGLPGAATQGAPRRAVSVSARALGPVFPGEGASGGNAKRCA